MEELTANATARASVSRSLRSTISRCTALPVVLTKTGLAHYLLAGLPHEARGAAAGLRQTARRRLALPVAVS